MNTVLQKWGNSLALRIPRTIAAQISVAEGQAVDLQVSRGRLVIAPAKKKQYELTDLIAGITAKNRHAEIVFDDTRGREVW